MNQTTLPLREILVIDRQRQDLGDVTSLADSIRRVGLIHPIVVDASNRLIAGGRRYAACTLLGLEHVPVTYREKMTEDELQELELEENIRRKDITWQERCLAVAKIHNLKSRRSAIDGESWGMRQTCEMLGTSVGNVQYSVLVAKRLANKDDAIWKCEGLNDALRLLMREREDQLLAAIARKERATVNTKQQEIETQRVVQEVKTIVDNDALAYERERYAKNPLNTVPFDVYWQEKVKIANEAENTMYLSNRFICGDSITYMLDPEREGLYDHIITDIPYGIDMSNLEQENTGMDVSTVEAEHDVTYNMTLIRDFFPAAFFCTKPSAFVVTWCDQDLWEFMKNVAKEAGFAVQRWPITWVKTSSCMNQAAQYNYTKSTEIAIVCRKPGAVLAKPSSDCVVHASNEKMKKLIDHPFAKPQECWDKIINHVSFEGQLVLEPFAGRGSGTLSLLWARRNVISVEKNVEHFNALLENVKQNHYLKLNPKYVFK